MINNNKNVIRVRSSYDDQEKFQLILMGYDPQGINSIKIFVQIGNILKKDQPFCVVQETKTSGQGEEPSIILHHLSIKRTLIVQQIGSHFKEIQIQGKKCYSLEKNIKKGSLMLLHCRQCDHESLQEVNSLKNKINFSQLIKSKTCIKCNEQYIKSYHKQSIQITLAQLLKSQLNPFDSLNEIQWQIKLNQQFTPNTTIAKFRQEEITIGFVGKAVFLFNFQQNYNKVNQETIVLKIRLMICNHDKILGNKCLNCLLEIIPQAIEKDYSNFLIQGDTKNILKIKGDASSQLQQKYISTLMFNKKLVMVLDLDNTILHSNEVWQLNQNTIMDLKDFYVLSRYENHRKDMFIVKMRPFFKHFIFQAIKYYEIYVYTKGTRVYAEQICKCIRMQYAGQVCNQYPYKTWEDQIPFLEKIDSFKLNRIISRDQDPNLNTKNIFSILPHSTEYHLILDDRRDVWGNSQNWYFTVPYNYFIRKSKDEAELLKDNATQVKKQTKIDIQNELKEVQKYISEEKVQNQSLNDVKKILINENKQAQKVIQSTANILFQTEAIKKEDYYLLFAAYSLRKIHHTFFEIMRKEKEKGYKIKDPIDQIDIKITNQVKDQKGQSGKIQKKRDKKLSISEIYMKMRGFWIGKKVRIVLGSQKIQPPHHHRTIQRAKKLGMIPLQNDEQAPQLIIRVNNLSKIKEKLKQPLQQIKQQHIEQKDKNSKQQLDSIPINKQQNMPKDIQYLMRWNNKIPIVSQAWVNLSYQYTFPFPYQDFILQDPLKDNIQPQQFDKNIQKSAKSLQKQIQDRMKRQFLKSKQ